MYLLNILLILHNLILNSSRIEWLYISNYVCCLEEIINNRKHQNQTVYYIYVHVIYVYFFKFIFSKIVLYFNLCTPFCEVLPYKKWANTSTKDPLWPCSLHFALSQSFYIDIYSNVQSRKKGIRMELRSTV